MAETLSFEDFTIGRIFDSEPFMVTTDDIKAFARNYDWLPFHVDEAVAAASFLHGLAASGWHVCAMMMRLIADSYGAQAPAMEITAIEDCKWLKPVRPGHALILHATVLDARHVPDRPGWGTVVMQWDMVTAEGEKVTEARGLSRCPTRVAETVDAS